MIDRRSEIAAYGGSTLRHYVRTIWRRKLFAIVPIVVITLGTFVAAHRQPAKWEVKSRVLINRQSVAATSVIGQTPAIDDPSRAMVTQTSLARVPRVAGRALAEAGFKNKPALELLNHSTVDAFADTLIFTVREPNATLAARLANAYAHQFVLYRRELDTAGLAKTMADLEQQLRRLEAAGTTSSPLYTRLADRQQQLESLEALSSSNVSVMQRADPDDADQTAPRPLRDTALAGIGSVVLGLIAIFLAEALSTKARSIEEVETLLGARCLGRVSLQPGEADLLGLGGAGGDLDDAFQAIRVSFELTSSSTDAKRVEVTGVQADSPSSAVATGLAVALARAGRHVVLVDLDLRNQGITRAMGLVDRPGVTTLATGQGDVAAVVVAIELQGSRQISTRPSSGNGRDPGASMLDVVPTGPLPSHPSLVFGTPALGEVLAGLARRADVVLMHLPPLLDAPDAAAAGAYADGVVLVVDERRARRPVLGDAAREIESWKTARLGFVLAHSRGKSTLVPRLRRARRAREIVAESERVA